MSDEWVSFICAVKPSVLIVAHLRNVERPYSGVSLQGGGMAPAPEGVRWPAIAPMDEYVREQLVPVVRGGSAGLERLEVRGVSRRVLGGVGSGGGVIWGTCCG